MNIHVYAHIIKAKHVDDQRFQIPIGQIEMWSRSRYESPAPFGWLYCDGMFYNREDYPDLANLLKPKWRWDNRVAIWRWFVKAQFRVPSIEMTVGMDWGVKR